MLSKIENESRKYILGAESFGDQVDVVMSSGQIRGYQYHGYIPEKQARVIPGVNVKVQILGFCSDQFGRDFEPIGEGWFVLGRWVHTGVFVVTEGSKPISFFAPIIGASTGFKRKR